MSTFTLIGVGYYLKLVEEKSPRLVARGPLVPVMLDGYPAIVMTELKDDATITLDASDPNMLVRPGFGYCNDRKYSIGT